MNSEWSRVKLGDVADIIGGGTPSTREESFWDGGIPWLTPKDLSGHTALTIHCGARDISEQGLASSSAKLLPTRSVLVSSRAPIGYVAVNRQPVATNQGFRSLVMKDGHVPEFFAYLLKGSTARLEAAASGSTFQEITGTALKSLEFVIPASHEQRRIAGVLAALDDKIEHERQLVKKLRSLIQGAAGKAVAFGSDVRTVGSIAEFSNKKRVPLSASERARRRGPYPYYGATGIFDYVDDFLFDDRYVLIGEDGSVVREDGSPFVQYVWGRLWVNNHAHVLTGNGLSTELLAVLLETANVSSAVTGAVQPKLSMGRLKSVEVSVPSDRAEIERLAAVVFGLVRAANDEIKTLSALRDELLPKLVSGALRVCGSYDPDDVLGTLAEEAAAAA